MAKPNVKAAEELPQVPATVTHIGGPPAELADRIKRDKGKGVSSDQSDNLVPLIYVLQPLSPQVNRRNAGYVEGAEPGAFWLRNALNPIVPGEQGLVVQSCYFNKDWVEWRPRDSGGGFVARHTGGKDEVCPVRDAVLQETQRGMQYVRPNGNEVILTRNHVLRVFTPDGALPYILPFTSTGHATSRAWMQLMNSVGGQISWLGVYRLVTRERTNPKGTWFGVEAKFERWATTEEYDAGLALHEAFASGAKQAEAPTSSSGGTDDEIPF